MENGFGQKLAKHTLDQIPQANADAKRIAGVSIAHRGDTEYLKFIPDGGENNNLGNLPSVSPEIQG